MRARFWRRPTDEVQDVSPPGPGEVDVNLTISACKPGRSLRAAIDANEDIQVVGPAQELMLALHPKALAAILRALADEGDTT